jgi:aerobic carbon-monoxide dehydrogenase medium subunit
LKPQGFEYHAPQTVEEAVELLGELGPDAKILAGGQSLIPLLNLRLAAPEHLIDIGRIGELRERRRENGTLRLGAGTRHAELLSEPEIGDACPLLPQAARYIGHPQIRTRGTMGGSLSHADPSAELPAVAVALDATMVIRSVRGERRVPARDFFVSFLSTDLADDELLVAIEFPTNEFPATQFPATGARTGSAFGEVAARVGDFAMAGAGAVVQVGEDDRVTDARIVCTSVAEKPVRVTAAEEALRGRTADDAVLAEVEAAVAGHLDPGPQLKESAGYKRRTAAVLARRAVRQSWQIASERTA